MEFRRAEMEAGADWREAERMINKALKTVAPNANLTVDKLLNKGDYIFDEAKAVTMLFYKEKPVVMFGLSNIDGEFYVERKKTTMK